MAVAEIDHEGFEIGSTTCLGVSQFNGSLVTSPAPESSKETYVARLQWKHAVTSNAFTDADDWITVGFYWRTTDATPTADYGMFESRDGTTGTTDWSIQHRTTGKLQLASYDVIASLTADTWYLIECKWNRNASGDIKIWVDGSLEVDLTGASLAGDNNATVKMYWYNAENGPSNYVPSFYIRTDDGANIDSNNTRQGNYDIIGPYQAGPSSTTPDWGATTLNSGTWANLAELPASDSNTGAYSLGGGTTKTGGVTCNDTRAGPLGDSDADGGFVSAKYVWRAKTDSAFPVVAFTGYHGFVATSDPSYPGPTPAGSTAFGNLSTSYTVYAKVSAITDANKAHEAQVGFSCAQVFGVARTATIAEQYVTILQSRAVATGRLALISGKLLTVT